MALKELEIVMKEKDRINKLDRKAFDDIYITLKKHQIRSQLSKGEHSNSTLQKLYDEVQIIRDEEMHIMDDAKDIIWLCVNPNETVCSFLKFKELTEKCFRKTWIKDYIYVFEQRGTTMDDYGRGYHLHAIMIKPQGKSPRHIIKELSNTFKHATDVSNPQWFNVQFLPKNELPVKLNYILGHKCEKKNDKAIKQYYDRIWRQKINLLDFYHMGGIDISEVQYYTMPLNDSGV